jgi:hypothetical protein
MRHLIKLLSALLLLAACGHRDEVKQVTIYPTYGYEDGDHWKIPMRIWAHTPRKNVEKILANVAAEHFHLSAGEKAICRHRLEHLVANDRSRQKVYFAFDPGPDNETFRIQNAKGEFKNTDPNGLIEGFIKLSKSKAEALLQQQGSQNGWLSFKAISAGHDGRGRIRLIPPQGTSVISDIDDTIKITDIPAGKDTVIVNTFFREFRAAPGMAVKYQAMADSAYAFHYVSGGPWQMYGPLAEYLIDGAGGFPAGSFHMKSVQKNLLVPSTWEGLHKLLDDSATYKQKVEQISALLTNFPNRRFILIGDSGEKDPEVYAEIRKRFGAQVREIRIRDVVNDREKNPTRLAGMIIIDPATGEISGPMALQ